MSRVRDWVDSNFRAAYKVIFGLCLFSLCLTLNIFADDSTKHVFLVIVDDDFSSQADVDIYNSEHGTSFVWQYDAFASIQPGIDSTIFGGTVNVQPGTYAGNINIDQRLFIYGSNYNIDPSGSLDRGNESVILGNVTISSASAKFDGFTVDGYNIIIEHVDDAVVSNNICLNTPGVGAIQALTEYATSNHSNRAYIGHNTISNAVSSGIYSDKNQDIVVEYNHIFNIIAGLLAGHGIMCDDGFGTGITIRNNIINTVGGIGISFEAGAGVVIENNQVTNAQREGIFLELNTGDYTVRGNTISYAGLNSGYGIRSKCRTKIENNSIDHCEGGIKADYFSSGETDRIEIKGNSISYIELAGIFVGSSNAYIYNNALLHCHIKYGSSLGPWDLASIHIGGNAKNSQVIGNVVFDGINGIQTWSDSTTISNNVIYGFGYSHDVFNIYATSVYKNSAILIGSNWIENNFNPEGTIIFNNSIHDNYFDLYYHDSLTYTINASGNWWGSIDPEVISSLVDDSTDFTPWLKSETDLNPGVPGFQGNYSQLVVGDGCIQTNSSGRIQEAIDMVTNGGTVNVLAGYYGEDTEIGTYWDSEEEGAIATGDNKTVNLFGPQKNIDPAGDLGDRPGGEAVIDGRIKINSYGSGIVVNGFKIIGDHAPMQKSAVFIQHGPGAEISHNIIVDSRKDGVQLGFAFNDTPGALLKNNYIYNSTECGILNFSNDDELNLGNADFEVSDNYIIESGYHGIHLNFKGLDNIIKNNVIDSNSLNDTAYYAIFNTTRTNIDSNIIANSSNGILTSYRGTGIGDRAEIKNNLISNISYPAITVGDWNLADNFGTYTYIYNNSITNCNHTGRNGNDNWQYGSITVLDNSNYTSLIANNISDGVKGITILADSVTIKNNIIDNMGQSYAGENSYNGNVYFNCGVQVGDSRPDEEKAIIFDPSGTVIYDNKIQNNYINIYQNPSLSRGINASANWWGSYNDDVFLGVFLCNSIDYTPWLSLASDTDPNAPGFQGSFAALWVDDNSPQYNDSGRIQEAMSLVKNNGSVYLMDGIYQNPFSADARTNVNLIGETREGTIFKPSQTIPWDVSTYGSSRQTAIRVVNSVNFNIKRMTIDFSLIGGDSRYGILYWNSIGEISNNNIKNMSSPNYYEFTSYFRAPGYGPESRAQISILNNTFSKTGRTAIMAHDYVDMHIEDNSFDQIDSDYGFAVELGSAAAGTIRNNSFANYATWELGDMVPVSAIYINNTYTDTVTGAIDKVVVIDSNNIADCQYGIFVGNTYEGFAGNVDIDLTISNNNIQGNNATGSMSSGGILITDEGKDRGSSVFAKIDNNLIDDDSDYGVYIYSEGNGDITAWLRYNWVINNFIGISVKDFGSPSSSAYDLVIHNNYLSNNLNAENDAAFGYWDDSVSIGNCWSDYEYIPGEPYYVVPGNAEAIDRFPNTACGDCSPGDADNNGNLNILDITRLIGYLYKDGPAPAPYEICSGDPNINCVVNILDITYIIAALYKDGPAPGTVENWFQTCGGPIRAPIVELNLTGEINIFDPTKIDKTPPQR